MTSNFKIDEIVSTVKSLQQEKACLEQKLRELRCQRAAAEKTRDSVSTKLAQAKEFNLKMKRTIKVAEHKVTETQAQLHSLTQSASQENAKIDKLMTDIGQIKSERMDEVLRFESQLSAMTTTFRGSRDFFKDESLANEIQKMNINIDTNENSDAAIDGAERVELIRQIKKIQLDADELADRACIEPDTQQQALSICVQELQVLNQDSVQLETENTKLEQKLASY